jgi:hypothetical protein
MYEELILICCSICCAQALVAVKVVQEVPMSSCYHSSPSFPLLNNLVQDE